MKNKMSPKDNLCEVINFGNPEYVPFSGSMPIISSGYYGVNPEDNRPGNAKTWTDLWQVRHKHELDGHMPFPAFNPLKEMDNWNNYEWPDPYDQNLYQKMKDTISNIPNRDELFIVGSHRSTLLERAWKLVGMENLFELMLLEPEKVHWLLDRIIEFQLGVAEEYIRLGIDIAYLGDDHGTQQGLLFSQDLFKKFFKPRYKRLIDFYKERHVLINFHSCGNILALIPDFIELGIDILNPIQALALDLESLRAKTMNKIALLGGVSTKTITISTPENVRQEVKERIILLGKNGGYICGPDQGMPFPPENIIALEKAVEEYGKYPISTLH